MKKIKENISAIENLKKVLTHYMKLEKTLIMRNFQEMNSFYADTVHIQISATKIEIKKNKIKWLFFNDITTILTFSYKNRCIFTQKFTSCL